MVCSVNYALNYIKRTAVVLIFLGRGNNKNTNIIKIIAFLFGKYKYMSYIYIVIKS